MGHTLICRQFAISYKSIRLNCADISHEESLYWPEPGGNCLNWVLGHELLSRKEVIRLLNQSIETFDSHQVYKRGTKPKTNQNHFLNFDALLTLLEKTQKVILKGFNNPNDDSDNTLSEIAFLTFHEAYHAGQIGLLRRLIGKEGQIK